jgi:hypothetical protein
MKLIDSNIIIYSALDDYRYLRPILKSPDSYASYINTRNVTDFDWIEGIKCHNPIDSQ